MIRAKNYETVSKFVKVMTKILWPLFSGQDGPKSKPVYYFSNFVYCQPTFTVLAQMHYRKLATVGFIHRTVFTVRW